MVALLQFFSFRNFFTVWDGSRGWFILHFGTTDSWFIMLDLSQQKKNKLIPRGPSFLRRPQAPPTSFWWCTVAKLPPGPSLHFWSGAFSHWTAAGNHACHPPSPAQALLSGLLKTLEIMDTWASVGFWVFPPNNCAQSGNSSVCPSVHNTAKNSSLPEIKLRRNLKYTFSLFIKIQICRYRYVCIYVYIYKYM